MNFDGEYFLGLDIGTDSVGYAVTDQRYNLVKFKGEPMWGSHLFDAANQCAERRGFRTARRRLDRRQQRVKLVDEIFAPEVAKVDPNFYIRKMESALYPEDKSNKGDLYLYFNKQEYDEKHYYKDYPTIHHLICALMNDEKTKFDIRLINIAIDWLVAHRGHFLSEVGTDSVDKVLDFRKIYDEFMALFSDEDDAVSSKPWENINPDELGKVLKIHGKNAKRNELKKLLYGGKIPTDEDSFIDRKLLIDFIAGTSVQCNKLFRNSEYEDDLKITISNSDEREVVLPQLEDFHADIIAKLSSMYDWSVLSDILSGSTYISESKVKVYEQHKKDLKELKEFVRKYAPEKYNDIFRLASKETYNYTAYSYNLKSVKDEKDLPKGKASKEDFYSYLKKTLKLDKAENYNFVNDADTRFFDDMVERISSGTFLPKQVNSDNRVIPYQVYYIELKKILENAKKHYAFFEEKDEYGYSNVEKIMSVFTFRIPYYVGPLRNDDKSPYAWIRRKADGKIYPWNFEEKVDLDASENAFIDRMTNSCTYIPGADVLPKWSLLYTKYMVLNEINNIKVNNIGISVEAKQGIYNELFCKKAKVSLKAIREYLISNGFMQKDDEMSGIDITVKSSLKSRYDFRHLLEKNELTTDDVEAIISRSTYAEDKARFKKWLKKEFPQLSDEDYKYVSKLKYKDFGRLSRSLLNGLEGASKETGEIGTIMHFLWETNDNLMQLLSDRYTFMEEINKKRQDYYIEHKLTLNEQMEELGISNAVKRPVTRTLAVVKDVISAIGYAPQKIFVEMARQEDEKKKRSVTRKEQILELYKNVEEDTKELERQLKKMGDTANNELQSDALFLYYLQLGKCMYSGKPIDLTQIKTTKKYDIDHIWPQSMVKDDSLLNNRVLVLSEINGDKKDVYPIDESIRSKMHSYWKMLLDKNLITKEKYSRLTRPTPFTESEKLGFINRQLVETRQSMKAVTQLLNNMYPDSEIVYVKAKLAADFKQDFKLAPKSRIINDLHHAKDAYLNVVAGNVYNERFTKKWFNVNEKYSMKTKVLFGHDVKIGDRLIWDSKKDLQTVKNTYEKNNIHLTRYAYCQKGGLFDQMPVKKGQGQIQLKKGMDIDRYGGYNKATASFFIIARYLRGGKKEVSFVPVELMVSEKFLNDDNFAIEYITNVLTGMNTKKIENVELPLGKRVIKIKTVLLLDGYKVWVNGKASGGTRVMLTSAESLRMPKEYVEYLKKMENYSEKKKSNRNFMHDSENDGLSEEKNILLYDKLLEKLDENHFKKMPGNQCETMKSGRVKFIELDFDVQISTLLNCIDLLKSGRTGGCDLKNIGGKSASGVVYISANLSACKYNDVHIIDISPAGLHENISCNLMELFE